MGLTDLIPFYNTPVFSTLCILTGLVILTSKLYKVLHFLYANTIRPEKNLLHRYGEGSYALITGASDGIGKSFCFSLAKRGFNIILAARNNAKLTEVEKEVKQQYPNVKTKIIVANFSECHKEGFFTKILDQIKDLDVSMLVNNVGMSDRNYLTNFTEDFLKEIITVNCIPQVVLSKHMIERFRNREKRSCILNYSSFTASFPMAMTQTYGATKLFNDYFSRSTALEYPHLDILSVRPGFVETKMTMGRRKPLLPVSTEQHTEAVLGNVGYETLTYGHWKHTLMYAATNLMPTWVRDYLTRKANVRLDGKDKKTK